MCADEDQHSDENVSTYNGSKEEKRRSTIFTGRMNKQVTSLLIHNKTISGSSLRAASGEIVEEREESEKSSFGTDSDHDEM